jgi:hypothetical protein
MFGSRVYNRLTFILPASIILLMQISAKAMYRMHSLKRGWNLSFISCIRELACADTLIQGKK